MRDFHNVNMSNEDAEQFRLLVEQLRQEEQRPTVLNEIRSFVAYKSAGEVVNVIRNVGFTRILQCLNSREKTHVELTCEVLRACFEKFNIGDVTKNFTGHIMYLLRHEKECVRKLAVDEVCKTMTRNPGALPVPQYLDVFVAVAQLVGDQDIGVANKAILIVSNLPLAAYPKVLDEMKIALEYSNSSKCNAFEVIVTISSKSPELLTLSAEHGYIDLMLVELQSNDILYQMNILELLSRLAVTPHGIRHLVEHGALQRINELVEDLPNNPLQSLLNPGYMKFFGSIAHLYPREIFEKYPALLDTLFNAFVSSDQTILPIALDTLGFIGTTLEGKLSLAALGSRFTQTVDIVSNIIRTGATDNKVRALYCMASLIGYDKDPNAPQAGPIDHRVTLMTREWFRSISPRPEAMETLQGICKNPFPEIRMAAFSLLDAACQHQWGEELVARTPGFIEYLLDRTVDHTKDTKEAKYNIIRKLSRSAAFDPSVIVKLTTYVDHGPFYSEDILEVAMDDGGE